MMFKVSLFAHPLLVMKRIIAFISLAIAFLSFLVMIWGIFHPSALGFGAGIVFGTSIIFAIIFGSPDDEGDSFIDHGRNLG